MRAVVMPLLLALVATAASVPSAHAAGWLPPVTVSGVAGAGSADVAVDGGGNVYVAWLDGNSPRRVNVSKRPVGGAFEPPETLDIESSAIAGPPDIGVDALGNAIVVWLRGGNTPTPAIVGAIRLRADSAFGTEFPIADDGDPKGRPSLAVNPAGAALLAWTQTTLGAPGVEVRRDALVSGFTASPLTRAEEPNFAPDPPSVALNVAGDAEVAWRETDGATPHIRSMFAASGSGFDSVETVPGVDTTALPIPIEPALDPSGKVTIAWLESSAGGDSLQVQTRDGSWGAVPVEPDSGAENSLSNPFALYSGTERVAFWTKAPGVVRAARSAEAVGPFDAPQTLSPQEGPSEVSTGDAPGGAAVGLAWKASNDGEVHAVVKPSGGGFGPVTRVSEAGHGTGHPALAFAASGGGAAAWDENASDKPIASAVYDATVPHIGSVDVPAAGTAGQPVSVTATASDDWAQPSIHWDFGDGATAGGGNVQHSYAAAGKYTVTATATDAAGNVASATREIDVAAAGQAPPPGTGPGPPGIEPPPPVDPPEIGKSFNVEPVKGTVLVSVPKGSGAAARQRPVAHAAAAVLAPPPGYAPFVRLEEAQNIPMGSLLDATKGTVDMTLSKSKTGQATQAGRFSGGAFQTKQGGKAALTTVTMRGFERQFRLRCRAPSKKPARVGAAARKRPRRRLFSNVHGRFRTRGRHSTATVRGTQYLVKDTCAGTLTSVSRGTVVVRDLVKGKNRTLRRGQRYLARPGSPKRRRIGRR